MSDKREILKNFKAQKSFIEERVACGIEKYRKGHIQITVTDKNGNAVKNAKIKAVQKKHEFKYGANLFMLDEFETHEKNQIYREIFSQTFNIATLPFYWDSVEPEEGKYRFDKKCSKMYRRPSIDLCVEFCKEHNIEPRAQGVCI